MEAKCGSSACISWPVQSFFDRYFSSKIYKLKGWKNINVKAKSLIKLSLNDDHLKHFQEAESGLDM